MSLPKICYMMTITRINFKLAQSSPGLPRTAITLRHQDRNGKYATDATKDNKDKISARRNNKVIGTWNVRTLYTPGELEELTHTLKRYKWNVLGLCEMRWKEMGKTTTHKGHKIYFSGRDDRHKEDMGFLVHKNTIRIAMECRPVSSRLITICSNSQSCKCMHQLQHTLLKKSKISTNKYRKLLLKHQRKTS